MISRNWPAPAKLNLMLHVVHQRQDGYHALQTVFQFIDLYDVLDFSIRYDGVIDCRLDCSSIVAEDNLVVRAANAIQQYSGCQLGAHINLQKNLPVGSGLGGGSSDAATTLVALNHAWKTGLSVEQLAYLGVGLGADVPVFIYGHAAWAEGVGEQLTAIELPECWYLVIKPDCCVSTKHIFQSADLTRATDTITILDFMQDGGDNDCDPVVRGLYPQIAEALDWLDQFADAKMTGTGACIFARFDERQQAQSVYEMLPQHWQGFVVRSLNNSPLKVRLQQETT